ncbi:phage tail protein [Clostridium botulinum]|uniref:Tail fiber protein n=1 Tax=Clostridium botulinum (strain Hall / ATCC 3502 / NCTC 13319 / Type A) TaxID=441771 RepID=A5I4A1_CLOBH|nr:phage tail protein [Clostridium botulinum]NFL68484.1 phage tail protein [Clostridium botulinum]NFQ52964.1 phage tail protein [Clostridium botulinum]NFT45922.1 phage tail protein [Clostridium botulinum]QGT41860.1 Desiccation/radiation resistance protein [Clostridium botulinum]CAL83873.1 putative tail fiber protein [Clostridium botulinum A str. ATCC 3502]
MAEKFYTLLTEIGKAKIANSAGFGSKVNFVKMKVGDGGGSYYNPREDQEDLINTVWEGNITHVAIDEKNPNWINVEMMIPANVGGFMIREYGVFDEDNNMLAIAKCAESYKPLAEDGSTKELIMKMVLTVSNTENITLKIDPTIIFAKKSEIEVLENKIKNIKVPVTKVNEKIGDVVLTASDIKTEDGKTVESQLADITKQIDNIDLSADKVTLNSSNIKSKNVKGALEELFTSASNGKNKIATAITGKGIQSSGNDSFDTLSNKIKQIPAYSPANLLIEVKRSSPITIPDYDTIEKIALDVYGKIYCKSTKILSKIDEDGYIYWQYTHDRIITSVTVKNGYVYIADWEGNRIIKINSSSGEIIWNNRYSSKYGTESIVIDDNNIIYAGTDNGKVIKIDSTGEVIWTYDKHKSRVDAISIDKNGYIYSGGGNRLVKLCSNGGEEWIRDFGRSIASIAIDSNGYIYIGFINYGIVKINPDNGEQIWHVDLGLNISANSIFVDDYVYVASSDKIIRKISLDGLQIWKYYCDYNLRSIIKRYSYIYIGHDKIVRKLTDEIYVKK